MMEQIQLDEGYAFGIGAFETIAVESGRPVFLTEHLARLMKALKQLGLSDGKKREQLTEPSVTAYLTKHKQQLKDQHGVLKIMVSAQNTVFSLRPNHYRATDYERGFQLITSEIRRNESSPLTYLKSLAGGDNILEKRSALSRGYDEPIFINSRGELAEGAVSNIFFCRSGRLYTPKGSCGMLPGIMRGWIIQNYPVEEVVIHPDEVGQFDEMFITNSLMGIMPVMKFDNICFKTREKAIMLQNDYKKLI